METAKFVPSSKYMIPQSKSGRMHNETFPEKNLYPGQNAHRQFDVEDISILRGTSSSIEKLLAEGNSNTGMPAHESQRKSCLRSSGSEGNYRSLLSQSSSISASKSGAEIGKGDHRISPGSSDSPESNWSWEGLSKDCHHNLDAAQSNVTRPLSGARSYKETNDFRPRNHELETIWDSKGSSRGFAVGSRARAWRSRSALDNVQGRTTLSELEKRRTLWKPSFTRILPDVECPICMEVLDETDSSFSSCSCGFKLCLFCHHKIAADDGRCPGCRKSYDPKFSVHENSNLNCGVF